MKHEKNKHGLKFDCDICFYGGMYLKSSIIEDDDLLLHIKEKHLPLKCKYCQYCFNNIAELFVKTCCEKQKNSSNEKNKSTIISGTWMKGNQGGKVSRELRTSTPMGGYPVLNFETDAISPPVETSSNSRLSGVTPINNSETSFVSPPLPLVTPLRSIISKRKTPGNENKRVTFSESVHKHTFPSISNMASPETRKYYIKKYFCIQIFLLSIKQI